MWLDVYIKGFKGEGLYKLHASVRQNYVLGLYMLGTSGYKVWYLGFTWLRVI